MHKSQQLSYLSLSSATLRWLFRWKLCSFMPEHHHKQTQNQNRYMEKQRDGCYDTCDSVSRFLAAYNLHPWYVQPLLFWFPFQFQFRKRPFIINTWFATTLSLSRSLSLSCSFSPSLSLSHPTHISSITSFNIFCGHFACWYFLQHYCCCDEWFSIWHFFTSFERILQCLYGHMSIKSNKSLLFEFVCLQMINILPVFAFQFALAFVCFF